MFKVVSKKELEGKEKLNLAPYAALSANSAGREFAEDEDRTRTIFQHDRDRIIHSQSFRRLRGKTQVFVATYGDHFRDRLTHTLEVAQAARGIARSLSLNEDLAETIALAHDLGHTPFGHAGEAALDGIMQKFGMHFEHNEQSKRIVEKLEKYFPDWNGLNLSFETRHGLAKHQTLYDQNNKKMVGKILEAQVVDLADEIAYHNHDLDDGMRSKLFTTKDLARLKIWKEATQDVYKKYGKKLTPIVLKRRVISRIISVMIKDVVETAAKNIQKMHIRKFADVLKQKKSVVCFSVSFNKKVVQLRRFLWDKMYRSPKVLAHSRRGQKILKTLFRRFYKNPKLMPRQFYGRIDAPPDFEPLPVIVKDYVAGMTDQFAIKLYEMSKMQIQGHKGR